MRLIAILSTLLTFPVFACPELSGHYKFCRSSKAEMVNTSNLSIFQRVHAGITIYHLTSISDLNDERIMDTFKADGKSYEQELVDADTGGSVNYTSVASCEGQELIVKVGLTSLSNEEALTIRMSRIGKKLMQKVSGKNLGKVIKDTIVCE